MIPILYEKNERAFISNGLGRLYECISCIVTEERNGIYECDFEYPVSGRKFNQIYPGRIVAVEHDDSNDVQPFDIVSYSKPINGVVTFHAVHISYRQSYITVVGRTTIIGTRINSLAAAFNKLKQGIPTNPFSYETDKTGATGFVAAFDGVPRSVRQLLGGVEGSILDTFGGEYEFDKFRVILHENRGANKSLTIRYGVNMVDFNDSSDFSESFVSCVPFWTRDDGNGGTAVVTGAKTNSGLISYSERDECVPLDLTEKFEKEPTSAQLANMARSMMTSGKVNQPNRTISVDFIRLQESSEYRQLAPLMECKLCDSVRVVFPKYDVLETFKIVKTEYDVLSERYKSMELGNLSATLSSILGASGDSPLSNAAFSGGSISLGSQIVVGVLTANASNLIFSINLGRVIPEDLSPTRLRCGVVARASNANGAGLYIIKATAGGSSRAALDTDKNVFIDFYNAADQHRQPTFKPTMTLEGGTIVYVSINAGTQHYFSGNSTNSNSINNNAVSLMLMDIIVDFE